MKLRTVGDVVHDCAARLEDAGVAFGQGTTDPLQEAMWLAAHVLGRPWDALVAAMDAPMPAAKATALEKLTEKRIATRKPAAYLLNEAWLGPHKFYVDERVIVPRSFIGELLLSPWVPWSSPRRRGSNELGPRLRGGDKLQPNHGFHILDLCTGSGCLAILAALKWPTAQVDAADLSEDALAVAKRNVSDYKLGKRIRVVKSDLFSTLDGRTYDLILSNPPYVKAAAMKKLPDEFRKEPVMALASGSDGLDHTREILREAKRYLNPGGTLVVEIGHNRKALEKAFPKLPFHWPKTSSGAAYVFTVAREELS